jgi:hypothetical protein
MEIVYKYCNKRINITENEQKESAYKLRCKKVINIKLF